VDGTAGFLQQFDHRDISLSQAIAQIAALGYRPLVVDRTGEDLQAIDIVVACVVIPGLHPLHVGLGSEHRDTKRLKTIAKALHYNLPSTLNLDPHPFP